jgi:hypothetical protein
MGDMTSTDTQRALPKLDFSPAKTALSEVMTRVIYEHQPQVVSRHSGREEMLLIRPDDLASILGEFRFHASMVVNEGEATVEVAPVGVIGFGDSIDEAIADAATELNRYAQRYFEGWSFYRETDRAAHAPWLLRFALTDREHQTDLLIADAQANAPRAAPAE